jgi:predicted short-subunit dehydrogenase-like oxidoreductase (DUF2520 family)
MISVVIIGAGNVSTHLTKAFLNADAIDVIQINSRKLDNIPAADIAIIAVSDDAIAEVSSKINSPLVVHTSGSVSMDLLKNTTRKGVFYPLQTFSKGKKITFKKVPFCIETTNESDYLLLEKLAKSIGKKVYRIDSEQRNSLHVAAVFVNNFTNHLYQIGSDLCETNQVPFEILQPLIKETADKIKKISPKEAQTGPAKRNDLKTIENHLNLLNNRQQEIYKTLTKSIQHGEKL